MQRDKLTPDPKYFTTCQFTQFLLYRIEMLVLTNSSMGTKLSALNAHMTFVTLEKYGIQKLTSGSILSSWKRLLKDLHQTHPAKREGTWRILIGKEWIRYTWQGRSPNRRHYISSHEKIAFIHQNRWYSDVKNNLLNTTEGSKSTREEGDVWSLIDRTPPKQSQQYRRTEELTFQTHVHLKHWQTTNAAIHRSKQRRLYRTISQINAQSERLQRT
jgi:hypothetical protein